MIVRLLIGPAPLILETSAQAQSRLLPLESSCQMQGKGKNASSLSMQRRVKETVAVLQCERDEVASILHW